MIVRLEEGAERSGRTEVVRKTRIHPLEVVRKIVLCPCPGGSLGGVYPPMQPAIAQSGRPPPDRFPLLLLRLGGVTPPNSVLLLGGVDPPQAKISCCCYRGSTRPQAPFSLCCCGVSTPPKLLADRRALLQRHVGVNIVLVHLLF